MSGFTVNTVVQKPKSQKGLLFQAFQAKSKQAVALVQAHTSGLALSALRLGGSAGPFRGKAVEAVFGSFFPPSKTLRSVSVQCVVL